MKISASTFKCCSDGKMKSQFPRPNGAPEVFPDINFCALGIVNFLRGKIFAPLNAYVFFVIAGLDT